MISLEWVSEYIDISDEDLKELARKITESGINIEKVITKTKLTTSEGKVKFEGNPANVSMKGVSDLSSTKNTLGSTYVRAEIDQEEIQIEL